MKIVYVMILVLFFGVVTQAQNSETEQENKGEFDCSLDGDSGHLSFIRKGRVVKVIDNDTVIFITDDGRKLYVSLIAVNSDGNKSEAKKILKNNTLGLDAEVILSSGQSRKGKISGILRVAGKDVNRLMLEKGIAQYKESGSYQISYYSDCVYYNISEKAKKEKLGIWAK